MPPSVTPYPLSRIWLLIRLVFHGGVRLTIHPDDLTNPDPSCWGCEYS